MSGIPQAVFLAPDDTLAAAGDDHRDRALIESLIVNDDRPNPWDLA